MARANYIYLVTSNGDPVAAFTVKWEMEAWISRNPGSYKTFRMRDGLFAEKWPLEMGADA